MRITHVAQCDIAGGAARAAWRLHQGLLRAGEESSLYVGGRLSPSPTVTQHTPDPRLRRRIRRIIRKELLRRALARATAASPGGYEHFRDCREEFGPEVAESIPPADLYNLHQIGGFLDYEESLLPLTRRAPVVWTLHEMSAMTGGCPYAYDCAGFTDRCGRCPQLGSSDEADFSREVWTRKRRVYDRIARDRLHIVCPSRWMAGEARRSSLLADRPIHVIPYGLDTEIFHPNPEARHLLEVFNLPHDARILLFVADYGGNRRKGFALLDQALSALSNPEKYILVSMGADEPRVSGKFRQFHLGTLSDDKLIAAFYSLADVFVIPSLEDNLPNTVLEAMACGTPCVGFRSGGIPDMIRHGETGLLADEKDPRHLREAIEAIFDDEARLRHMGETARKIAETEYPLDLQASRYRALYASLTSAG